MRDDDETYMNQALEAARRAPYTSPNPRVGAILVRDGAVIGEGWHEGAGAPHAETEALAGVDASGATMYVTLEPCTHRGHTGPCAPAVVDAGVSRVVIGLQDPDERVGGRGIAYLRRNGVEVEVGTCHSDVAEMIAPYLHHRRTGRAFLTLKLALALDGRIAAADGTSKWITGAETRAYVHRRRVEADAVLVGAGTSLADDPSLTARDVDSDRQPVRIVLDGAGRVPPTAWIFSGERETLAPLRRADGSFGRARHPATIVATTAGAHHDATVGWKEAGAEVLVLPTGPAGADVGALLVALGERGFTEVLCEGGAELATSLLREGIVDRLELHTGPVLLGGTGLGLGDLGIGSIAAAAPWRRVRTMTYGPDVVSIYEPEQS